MKVAETLLAAVAVTQHFVFTMPHTTSDDDNDFKHIQARGLHPTFGAEVHGVDFSKPVPEDIFSEIYKAITKVSIIRYFLSFSIVRQQITYSFHALPCLYARTVVPKNISVSFRNLTLFLPIVWCPRLPPRIPR
jgi:hypothetical protein